METMLTVGSGIKPTNEIDFLMDMLASDEVYLQDRTGWVRVIASAENAKRQQRQTEPESITIKLTMCDISGNMTIAIKDTGDFRKPRIFSEQHTDEFN